jgi:hypothetical protein
MILLVLIFIIIAAIDLPPILKKRGRADVIAFSVIYSMAFILSLLFVLDIKIPSPAKGFVFIVRDVLGISYKKH